MSLRPQGASNAEQTPSVEKFLPELLVRCLSWLPLPDRIRCATVCGYWRRTALDNGALWSDLENVDPALLPDLLERSKEAPIRLVQGYVPEDSIDTLCAIIQPHMEHIRHLELHLQPDANRTSLAALEAVLLSQAPILEDLSLIIDDLPLSLDTPLFGGEAHCLRRLTMAGWRFQMPRFAGHNVLRLGAAGTLTSNIFPNVPEVRVLDYSSAAGLWGPIVPARVTTLAVEFTRGAPLDIFEDAFRKLHASNFDGLRELTLVHAQPELVLQAANVAVALQLVGHPGPHVRVRTAAGVSINFVNAHEEGLDDALCRAAAKFGRLRELRLGGEAFNVFSSETIGRICSAARGLERLVLTGIPTGSQWKDASALKLLALRELHVNGGTFVVVSTDDFDLFVRQRILIESSTRLTLAGVKISDDREQCRLTREELDGVLEEKFAEVVSVPREQQEKRQKEYADSLTRPYSPPVDKEEDKDKDKDKGEGEDDSEEEEKDLPGIELDV